MLRTLTAAILIAICFACAHKDAGRALVKMTGGNGSENIADRRTESNFDSTFYIGYVDYFPETKEFYTALYYREGHEYPDEDLLQSKLDSVIILEEDWGRERLPLEEAKKMLVLSGLDTLSIYNRKHERIGRCPLTRVEYLWNGLESQFIAVFKSDGTFAEQTEELYGIGGDFPPDRFTFFTADEINNINLNSQIIKRLNLGATLDWNMRHYKLSAPDNLFTVISSYAMESNESQSYIAFSEGNRTDILNEEINNFHYLNILPVPVYMNGKPLLLISAGYPSSDVLWDYLAAFDGTRYDAVDFNRVHLKNIRPGWSGVLSHAGAK